VTWAGQVRVGGVWSKAAHNRYASYKKVADANGFSKPKLNFGGTSMHEKNVGEDVGISFFYCGPTTEQAKSDA
jgi:hypothetical protein